MYFNASVANQRSSSFSREAEVGVKCTYGGFLQTARGLLARRAIAALQRLLLVMSPP